MTEFVRRNRWPLARIAFIVLWVGGFVATTVVFAPLWMPIDYPLLLVRVGAGLVALICTGFGMLAVAINRGKPGWQFFWSIVAILGSAGLEMQNYIPGHWMHVAVAAVATFFGTLMGLQFPPPGSWDMSYERS